MAKVAVALETYTDVDKKPKDQNLKTLDRLMIIMRSVTIISNLMYEEKG